jgi:hypothetical protein
VALADIRSIRVVSPSATRRQMGANGVQEAALIVLAGSLVLIALLIFGA